MRGGIQHGDLSSNVLEHDRGENGRMAGGGRDSEILLHNCNLDSSIDLYF